MLPPFVAKLAGSKSDMSLFLGLSLPLEGNGPVRRHRHAPLVLNIRIRIFGSVGKHHARIINGDNVEDSPNKANALKRRFGIIVDDNRQKKA
jgi:hypothetical protein